MQALHRLDTAFTVPEASIRLSRSLRSWHEEVESLFPWRKGKASTSRKATGSEASDGAQKNADNDAMKDTTKPSSSSEGLGLRLIKRTRPNLGLRFVSKHGVLIDNRTWNSLYLASKALSQSLLNFLSAIHFLSDFERTWCATATGELMVTLEVRSSRPYTPSVKSQSKRFFVRKCALHFSRGQAVRDFPPA